MKLERSEMAIVVLQVVALIAVVLVLSNFSPSQSAQSTPGFTSVYWGASNAGVALQAGKVTKVSQNESIITAYFTVAFSTQVSAVSGSSLCVAPSATTGVSTVFSPINFTYDESKGSGTIPLSPIVQQNGWVCTYTIKVTDSLSQTTTWLGSVELTAQA